MDTDIAFVIYYIFCGLGITCSILSLIILAFKCKFKSCFSYLIFLLHFSIFFEEIFLIPFIYKGNNNLCISVAYIQRYFSMVNIVVIFFLVLAYRQTIIGDSFDFSYFINNYSKYIIFLFPLTTLFPLTVFDTELTSHPWCSLDLKGEKYRWAITYFYLMIWIILLTSIGIAISIIVYILKYDPQMLPKLYSTLGFYILLALNCWIPRSITRLPFISDHNSNIPYFVGYFPVYICGILFTALFLKEKKSLQLFEEKNFSVTESDFSWESEEFDMHSRATSVAHSVEVISPFDSYNRF